MSTEQNKIIVGKSRGQTFYTDIDEASGGYPYWTNSLSSAKFFTKERADRMLLSTCFRIDKDNQETRYPPRMIHSLCGLNNDNTSGSCEIYIAEITVKQIGGSKHINAHIKK